MDVDAFLRDVQESPRYRDQMAYVRELEPRTARYQDTARPLPEPVLAMMRSRGIERTYLHQALAIDHARKGRNVLVATGTASGKSLCYTAPLIEMLSTDREGRALLLFPTKALCQDQFQQFRRALDVAGLNEFSAGVYDGDTPGHLRRKLRDHARVIFSNPDMVHAALMPQHAMWGELLARLKLLVLDELHVYSGIFGSNMTNLLRRFRRVCGHYGSDPQIIACTATIGNPRELASGLTGRPFEIVDEDGSPRGKRTYVFWNPPRIRGGNYRSRRSANVEAHELMAMLVQRGAPTITFSKAKMTAEMIHRYVSETLERESPELVRTVTPYRGGYLPQERREIEKRLFDGELLGVSATPALELGIDVGGLEASILVGYPGTLASFFQQSGRAGRRDDDSLVLLVGLDTSINQYIMSHPDYIFGRPVEESVLDSDNPFVLTGHLRCATHELPVREDELALFGPHCHTVLRLLEENRKVRNIHGTWYHAAAETPQHEISLRGIDEANVTIEDVNNRNILGEVTRLDAPPILHPDAIYMHRGDTYIVEKLDLDKNVASVNRVNVDYYTQPLGGTDVHHVDHRLRRKPFGEGAACWGEVTAYFRTGAYEKVRFYELDAISVHPLKLPTFALDTMALWLVPPEWLMEKVRKAGLDAHSGLRGVGYATRMLLPLFMTCDTLDFSHSIGSINSEWNAIFIYERYPLGLGFTEKAYEELHRIMPAVLENIRNCPCAEGCPCCVGKPLRQTDTWNVERGEGSIPSKQAVELILAGMLGDFTNLDNPDDATLAETDEDEELRMEQALRRRLERMREPQVFHSIEPNVPTEYPDMEGSPTLEQADVSTRASRRRSFGREVRKRMAKKLDDGKIRALAAKPAPPIGMAPGTGYTLPTAFPSAPDGARSESTDLRTDSRWPAGIPEPPAQQGVESPKSGPKPDDTGASDVIRSGDSLAARARRLKKKR